MKFLPIFDITIFNGFLLIIPLLVIRLLLVKIINPNVGDKLDYFPPTIGFENFALNGYFILNPILIFLPIICKVSFDNAREIIIFVIIYLIGIIFLSLSVMTFSKNDELTTKGIYKFSRNPMYIGYLLIFIGVSISINSFGYLIVVILYQICVHFLILSEERYCKKIFGKSYLDYCAKTKRYL